LFSNVGVEDLCAAATRPPWFQLYVQPDRDFTRALVGRAEAAGCQALVLSVDSPVSARATAKPAASLRSRRAWRVRISKG